ncbi:MAG TPA: AGE family epimerase/isomerase [Cyclobacteriaceae bacterium]|nr:AGE family epimerase/isomerase [Cyclobacteriaceae bacterium]
MTTRTCTILLVSALCFAVACQAPEKSISHSAEEKLALADTMEHLIRTGTLEKWYPQAVDTVYGGYLSGFSHDFQPVGNQDKFIVTQARHTWTNAKAAMRYPEVQHYRKSAEHGFRFLRDVMWDKEHGGFHTLVDRQGNVKAEGGREIKTAYGNAFGIYGLAAYFAATGDSAGLELAKEAFLWLEEHSHDPVHKGYFQHLEADGTVVVRPDTVESTAETGFKDQNSSIHLLEAFTELYQVWPDSLLRERLAEMLYLIRDTIVTPKGYLTLFLTPDWKPVTFRDSTEEVIMHHHRLDHVSFGHDVETAYLMLEASHVLGIENDQQTHTVAKRMVDHALNNGWDEEVGGFYDEGYYFRDADTIRIIRDTKNWWAQAEGLNTLLMMSELYPDDPLNYYEKFYKLWRYVDTYIIDHDHGDWYSGGIDKQPEYRTAPKGGIWKGNYHQYRGVTHCVDRLRGEGGVK